MNHSAPPGGWEPQEPRWLGDMRQIEMRISEQVDRYIRARRWDFMRWFYGGLLGYWVGFGTAQLLKWWWGLK